MMVLGLSKEAEIGISAQGRRSAALQLARHLSHRSRMPTLTVIDGGGQPEPDSDAIDHASALAAKLVQAVTDGASVLCIIDGEQIEIDWIGDPLEILAVSEKVCGATLTRLLGL